MTVGLSKELAGDGIRVNAVAPGLIATDIHPPGRSSGSRRLMPIARAGTAEEVAETVCSCSPMPSSYTTGTNPARFGWAVAAHRRYPPCFLAARNL